MRPRQHGWLYPPTRREVTLLLFSLTIFVVAYNLETSLQLVGVHPAKLGSSYLSPLGLGTKDPGLEADGRRPKEWRDDLENLIFGDWAWEEGKVASVEQPQTGAGSIGAALYNVDAGNTVGRSAGRDDKGVGVTVGVTAHQQFLRWRQEVPKARAINHVPGFTILDNLIVANGTFFLVTDDPLTLPELAMIASSAEDRQSPRQQDWQIVSSAEAPSKLGTFGGRIFGTTWLSLDPSLSQDPYTLFSLFHTHNALVASASSGSTKTAPESNVPAPLRLIFPYVPTFSSPHVPPAGDDIKAHPPPREKSYNGLHPLLMKAALPTVGMWYAEDFQDLADMNVAWVFDRVVVADRGAANRGRALWTRPWAPPSAPADGKRQADADDGKPAWAAPFVGLRVESGWWAPMRAALLSYLGLPDTRTKSASGSLWGKKKAKARSVKPTVTYVSMQEEPVGAGPRLSEEDHLALLLGLRDLQREGVVREVNVVKGNGSLEVHGWEWAERMNAIARSSIVLGPYGFHLADSIFMAPSAWSQQDSIPSTSGSDEEQAAAPLLMEFFPPGTFVRDQEFAVRSLGMRYIAWWNDRKFTGNSLPPVILPDDSRDPDQRISIDADAIMGVIRDEIARRMVPD